MTDEGGFKVVKIQEDVDEEVALLTRLGVQINILMAMKTKPLHACS